MPRIDVHHHFFPPILDKVKLNKEAGWRTPPENLPMDFDKSIQFMDRTGISVTILSFPTLSSGEIGEESRKFARQMNVFISDVCKKYSGRFGFFATLPFLDDVEGALAEIAYAFDVLKADGVALSSSYGSGSASKYIGHDLYDPVWAELHKRQAVVFLHGAQTPSSTPYPHETLGIPITEVPNETFKAAAHLVVTGRKRKYSDIKIILAHLGGTVPFLSARVAVLSNYMGCPLTPEEIIEDFKSFYFDTALGAHETTLTAMDFFVTTDRILFGSDFPAVSESMVGWYTKNLESFYATRNDDLDAISYKNALRLFPRMAPLPNKTSESSSSAITLVLHAITTWKFGIIRKFSKLRYMLAEYNKDDIRIAFAYIMNAMPRS